MAYMKEIWVHQCFCGAKATVEVYTWQNSLVGWFCKRHGRQKVVDLDIGEKSSSAATT